jgi:serine/threonine protein kinase
MDWPNLQDYNEAIQHPHICFSKENLRKSQIEVNAIGLPRPVTGAFASVYKATNSDGTFAIRCFHNEIPDLDRRYTEILREFSSKNSSWSVETEYIKEGIFIRGRWFPIVKMEWTDGLPLDRYLAKHGQNQTKVTNVAKQLRSILDDLRARGIAHGDLQHGNIVVSGDVVKLLDYDGFFVPALDGLKSAELGHANYQHPYRTREHFGSYIDNFPAWLITISLLSIAADPDLLSISQDRECLLFAHSDLVSPYESELFRRLREHPLEEVKEASRTLIRLLSCPVESIPFLDANEDELLNLPEMDLSEQLRLVENISGTDSFRFLERPQSLSALQQLSTTRRVNKNRFGSLLKQASTQGAAMLSSMIKQKMPPRESAEHGDSALANGNYTEAIAFYLRAWEQTNATIKGETMRGETRAKAELRQLDDHLNMRLGICQLMNDNAGSAVFHFKNILRKLSNQSKNSFTLEAIVGLMMAYCQQNRQTDAQKLMHEMCNLRGQKPAVISAEELSVLMLAYGNGMLAQVPGLKKALRVVAQYFEQQQQYGYAASLYATSRVQEEAGTANDLELSLIIGHCHLLDGRPDLAMGFLNSIRSTPTASEKILDRAAVAQAVAFKMTNKRQDIAKVMRSRLPENLYNCFKSEADGLLGNLEVFAEVIAAFGAELGEANLMGGVRMATRLAADNFKRIDDKKSIDEINRLLDINNFEAADKLVTDEFLQDRNLRRKFVNNAQIFARNLATSGSYNQAFALLEKYDCPQDLVVEAIENDICDSIRKATRDLRWDSERFDRTISSMEAYFSKVKPSIEFFKSLADLTMASKDRTDEFLTDVRRLADVMASRLPDGGSNQLILKMRAFVLEAESNEGDNFQEAAKPQKSESALGAQLMKATRAATVSTTESTRARQLEGEVLQTLRMCSQTNWDAEKFESVLEQLQEMKRQRSLTSTFCDKVASIILEHFAPSSGLTRWNKQASDLLEEHAKKLESTLTAMMGIFASVPDIDPGTLRKLRRSMERFEKRG